MHNCQIVQYSKTNPYSKKSEKTIKWVRSICYWDMTKSRNNWIEINKNKTIKIEDLKEIYENIPKLF